MFTGKKISQLVSGLSPTIGELLVLNIVVIVIIINTLSNDDIACSIIQAGYTPLHTACHFGQLNMIRFLLEHGASVNATTKVRLCLFCDAQLPKTGPYVWVLLQCSKYLIPYL